MEIKRSGSQLSGKGPAEYFTGMVRVGPLFNPPTPARVFGASVTFEPSARTAWHTHPLGQTLIVTAGSMPSHKASSEACYAPSLYTTEAGDWVLRAGDGCWGLEQFRIVNRLLPPSLKSRRSRGQYLRYAPESYTDS
jgi:hypothetical protein